MGLNRFVAWVGQEGRYTVLRTPIATQLAIRENLILETETIIE